MVKNKICLICRKQIKTKTDNYTIITDFQNGKKNKEGCYHSVCFVEKIKGKSESAELKSKANSILNRASSMLGNAGY